MYTYRRAANDTIQLKVKGPWGDSEMTLKRVAEKKSDKVA